MSGFFINERGSGRVRERGVACRGKALSGYAPAQPLYRCSAVHGAWTSTARVSVFDRLASGRIRAPQPMRHAPAMSAGAREHC